MFVCILLNAWRGIWIWRREIRKLPWQNFLHMHFLSSNVRILNDRTYKKFGIIDRWIEKETGRLRERMGNKVGESNSNHNKKTKKWWLDHFILIIYYTKIRYHHSNDFFCCPHRNETMDVDCGFQVISVGIFSSSWMIW